MSATSNEPPPDQVAWMRSAGLIFQQGDYVRSEAHYLAPGGVVITVPLGAINPAILMSHCMTCTRENTLSQIRKPYQAFAQLLGIEVRHDVH